MNLESTKNVDQGVIHGMTILIIDDGIINIKMLEGTLSKEGYTILSATNGPDGRKIAITSKPDLIILDVMMPGEDGFEVIRKLKSDSRTASIPVMFLTGKEDFSMKIRGFNFGAVDYLIKPCHPLEVKARVKLHLKLSFATNALIASQAEKLKQIQDAQTSMLTDPKDFPGAKCHVCYVSLDEAGGDFYEVLQISDNIYGYFVADVSGHDIGTSYITPSVKALLQQNCTPIFSPLESMNMINSVLVELMPTGKYLTACYAKLNRDTMVMSIVNAAHPPIVYIPVQGDCRLIEIEGDILGIYPDGSYSQVDINVSDGDRFFAYSDGLIEVPTEKKVWTEALSNLLKECEKLRGVSLKDSVEFLYQNANAKGNEQDDDIVILGIEV